MPIAFTHVTHEYSPNTAFSYVALKDISVSLPLGKMVAIVGNTGSGKSTLIQHLNALLLPTKGSVEVLDRVITSNEKPKQLKALRKRVGLVFQFPEYQLFEETIAKDLCFGPKNFGVPTEEAQKKAIAALKQVGMDESYLERSPFDLSGGQKRRVAIAGILAMDPEVLVLDEPTAGLDPQGARQMMELFVRIQKEQGKSVFIVTHDMEHVLNYCDEVVVMKDGAVIHQGNVDSFFQQEGLLGQLQIAPPQLIRAKQELKAQGLLEQDCHTIEELAAEVVRKVAKR